jgi:putative ABC transport system permease protein
MIKNYFTIALRNLKKNKLFSFINISGLAIGLAVFLLIMLWIGNELSYNNFHEDKERIAALMVNKKFTNNEIASYPAVPSLLAPTLIKDLPGIEYASRSSWGDVRLLSKEEKKFTEYGLYVDHDFLNIFTIPLIAGNKAEVLKKPHTILLSETLAQKYFGKENPIGKEILVERTTPYIIEGIFKDIPSNATLTFDYLMPVKDYFDQAMGGEENWTSNNMRTYVKIKPGVNMASMNMAIKNFMDKYTDQQANTTLFLWELKDWYLRFDFKNGIYAGGGRIKYVKLFSMIAFFILLLACINFMNLSTAGATRRAKEVGVRKVLGAEKKSLIGQFMSESVMLSFLAGILALIMVALILPSFNQMLNRKIGIEYTDPKNIAIFMGIILLTGLLAGSYPSWILAAFKPVKVLKSSIGAGAANTAWIRKFLVVTQFTVSVLLIIGTIVVSQQIKYINNKNLGYEKENLVWFPNNIELPKNDLAIQEFLKVPGVSNVSRASMTFTMPNNRGTSVSWPGKPEGEEIFFSFITSDHDILQTMGIQLKEGRGFSKEIASDTTSFILNEEAVKRMGLKNPVGQQIESFSGKGTIIGVVKDFHFESLHNPISPVIINCKPEWTWLYYARLKGDNIQQSIKGLESVYAKMAPGFIFDYNFQDKEYERLYKSESQTGALVNWFAFVAIFISCLGLLGLTAFTVERKTKEIGIRKVLGASVIDIVSMVSKNFLYPIALAIIIAIPVAFYLMNNWLQQYVYRIEISWWIFGAAAGMVLLVALLTISFQSIKAALVNPVKSLRTE